MKSFLLSSLCLIFLLFQCARATTFFAPDSDTALLFELVSTTASQLNELEKLVTNTEKYTHKMREYNEIVEDHYFRAERMANLVDEMKTMTEMDEKSLESLNDSIRNLREQLSSVKSLIRDYEIRESKNIDLEKTTKRNDSQLKRDQHLAHIQLKRSEDVQSQKGANKLTAQNTALINKSMIDLKNQNNQILNKMAEQNAVLLRKERTSLEEKQKKEKFYKL